LIVRKIIKIAAISCHFKAEMHQIRFLLELRPRPRWGSLQHSPDPLTGYKGPTSKGKVKEKRVREERKGKDGRETIRRERRGRDGKA